MTYRLILKWALFAMAASIGAGIAILAMQWKHARADQIAADDALARAVQFVGQEVDYMTRNGADEAQRRFYALLSTASYVQANLSSARYGRLRSRGVDVARFSSGQCLAYNAGICGDQVSAAVAILNRLDIPARVVGLYYEADTGKRAAHAVLEAQWDESWHMMDVTWGFLPLGDSGPFDVLSVEEVFRGLPYDAHRDDLHPWTTRYRLAKLDPLEYLHADPDIIVSGSGTIRPSFRPDDPSSYALNDVPAYVGHGFSSDGRLGEIRYALEPPAGPTTLTVKATHWNCDDGGTFVVNEVAYPFDREMVFTDLYGPVVLRVDSQSTTDHCYVSLAAIEVG